MPDANLNDHQLVNLLHDTIGMLSFDRVVRIATMVMDCSDVQGDIVEFGCHEGRTAALIAALMHPDKTLWLYDSFQGLPKPQPGETTDTQSFFEGSMKCSPSAVMERFAMHGLKSPRIIAKWFKDITAEDLPKRICFAHIDCDLYEGTKQALKLVTRLINVQSVVIVDDVRHPHLTGVNKAVREYACGVFELLNPTFGVRGEKSIHQVI